MTQSSPILQLPIAQKDQADEADMARAIEEAAQIVEGFATQNAEAALDAVLALAGDEGRAAAAQQAKAIADEIAASSDLLDDEVARFMSLRQAD